MLRLRDRFWGLPSVVPLSEEDALDNLYFFAVTCHHLLDWLVKDPSNPIGETKVKTAAKRYVEGVPELEAARDLCNGSKHAVLHPREKNGKLEKTEKVKTKTEFELTEFEVTMPVFPTDYDERSGVSRTEEVLMYRPLVFVEVTEKDDPEPFEDAATFADLCIAIWRSKLEARGLSVPTEPEEQEPPEIYQNI